MGYARRAITLSTSSFVVAVSEGIHCHVVDKGPEGAGGRSSPALPRWVEHRELQARRNGDEL